MSKRNIIITVVSVIIILLLLFGLFIWLSDDAVPGDSQGNGFSFFPFGRYDDGATEDLNDEENDQQDTPTSNLPTGEKDPETGLPAFRQITEEPIAGATFAESNGREVVRYISRETGHVFDAYSTSTEVVRISNTTIPGLQEVLWVNTETALLRYFKDGNVRSFFANLSIPDLSGTTTEEEAAEDENLEEITGFFLPNNIHWAAPSPDSTGFVTIQGDVRSGSTARIYTPDGSSSSEIMSYPFSGILVSWPSEERLGFTGKASEGVPGESFLIDRSNGNRTQVLSNVLGLTTLYNKTADELIYSSSSNDLTTLFYRLVDGSETQKITLTTLPDKCVWSSENNLYCGVPTSALSTNLPDSWYMGKTTFTDEIWKIDPKIGGTNIVFNGFREGVEIDAIDLRLNQNEDRLILTNKKDYSLWMFELPQEEEDDVEDSAVEEDGE